DVFAGKKSAQIREILISESAWEEMTCLFAPSLAKNQEYKALTEQQGTVLCIAFAVNLLRLKKQSR
ncbi:MAG: hypothetical protein E6927_24860, partial [Klebsiella michiganensis]|nr:hypothetical protein [Klebsiella michiganensis]